MVEFKGSMVALHEQDPPHLKCQFVDTEVYTAVAGDVMSSSYVCRIN